MIYTVPLNKQEKETMPLFQITKESLNSPCKSIML